VGAIPVEGAGVRMMWYPNKAAFRAGRVTGTQWDDANIGLYSLATGYNATASGNSSTAMGAVTTASGTNSTAMGYLTTASGLYSTAMGRYASTAGFMGAFVYGDASTTTVLSATATNQFSVRAAGGIRLFTNSAQTAGMTLAAGGSSWTTVSDRARKHDFGVVDGEDLLARIRGIPVMSWRYIAEEDATVRHIGPMAQDWDAALPELGGTGLTINMSDLDGVNLAAIQALEFRSAAQAEQIAAQKEQITAQKDEITAQREEIVTQREEIVTQREEIAAQRNVIADLLARVQRLESRPHDSAARRR
jgi:trimeric autotransporter adhesin